jgi:hypothetical protein
MKRKKPGAAGHDPGQHSETRAGRRARTHAPRTVARALQHEIAEQREKRSRRILGWIFNGFTGLFILAAVMGWSAMEKKILDPHIDLWGEVVDEQGRPIPWATVEWSTWRDDSSWRNARGRDIADDRGVFRVYGRLRGDGLTIHRISATGYRDLTEPRSFRYYKDPWRYAPDDRESSTFVLKRGRRGQP